MRKNLLLIVLVFAIIFPVCAFAADTKISALTADGSPGNDSLVATVDDPGGTPATRKTTIGELFSAATDLDANGVISADSVALGNDTTGNYADADAEAGVATSAATLAANGGNCAAGSAPLGVDAAGAVESCTDYEEDLSNSAGLAAALSDETGTGKAVFQTSPTVVTPVFSTGVDFNLAPDDNITIDARTNPRTVTLGAMRWNHTPDASTPNTRALFLDIDANSVPNTQGLHVDLKATAIAAGETVTAIQLVGDTADSSGGHIRLMEFDKTGTGSAEVHAIHVDPEVAEVIHHASGTFIDPTQGWSENGGFTDTTTAFGSSGTDVSIFTADNDAIYIGAETVFQEVEVVLNTVAANPGVKPVFEIWTGASWTTITPTDGTAGFRENGIIDLEGVDLSSWAATTVNSVSKFYLQVTRTQNSLGVTPIEDLIQTAVTEDFIWDGDGNLNINTIVSGGATGTGVHDYGEATSIEIVNAAGPTVDAAGEIAVDTTDDQLIYYGGAKRVITYKHSMRLTIENPNDNDNILISPLDFDITITAITCLCDPADSGESVVIIVQERDGDGDNPAGVDGATTITCANTDTDDDGSLSNPSIDADDYMSVDIGVITGTVTQVAISIYYTIDAE